MKRRVVAIMLSLTLCMGGTLEAGATALSDPDIADSRGRHWLRRQLQ